MGSMTRVSTKRPFQLVERPTLMIEDVALNSMKRPDKQQLGAATYYGYDT
jgi:hypothetical protein